MISMRLVAYLLLSATIFAGTCPLSAQMEQVSCQSSHSIIMNDVEEQAPSAFPANSPKKPRKLSWKEWFCSLGSSIAEDSERPQLPGSLLLLGATLIFLSSPEVHFEDLKSSSLSGFLMAMAAQYTRYLAVNFAHEGGHALANYFVNGKVSDVYLGTHEESDGVEVIPHVTLSGLDPSIGCTTNIGNQFYSEEKFRQIANKIHAKFAALYPSLSSQELLQLSEYQRDFIAAKNLPHDKSLKQRLKFFVIAIAGVASGLITNGLLKLWTGTSLLSIDHFDIKQLLNLIPTTRSDGGIIIEEVLDAPSVVAIGNELYQPTVITSLLIKALAELHTKHPNRNPMSLLMHALGLVCINYASMGKFHCTGN